MTHDDRLFRQLAADSPVTRPEILTFIQEFVDAGEYGLAFDTLCAWIQEDELPITRAYFARLVTAADALYHPQLIEHYQLDKFIIPGFGE
ncbi:MafI family immunity protein [Nocardia camponoti]|uniref:MafI family immunity protein n=1 Tax=Nocardia camponoti TaxID=1616106 RepID=UPI00166A3C5C|nr:MafI family immunity protein [Nocardia camponoti]